MKTRLKLIALCHLLSAICFSAPAQGTAFTYQGRLNDGANPANGVYDLKFTIYDSTNSPGTVIAGPVTNSATGVNNGLFTATLDFGTSVFTGADRWLEIGVRTNDGGSFFTLSPRQQVTTTPYAITAGTAASLAIPSGMALIPARAFTMGDNLDGEGDATPISVTVSAFYMDANLVSYSQWQSVYYWATNHGFGFANAGSGKAANHPVQTVDWYNTVKWCNARSQQAGKTPVYYTDAGLTQVYTNGEVTPYVNWTASGYRLPTEAEWEKAARGGLSGQRFPWGNVITESLASYKGETASYNYDLGPNGYNAAFTNGVTPYTSPVGYFAPNGHGLYDMAGNVFEWCWDWYGTPYPGGSDPRGPASGSFRVLRSGHWNANALYPRVANRGLNVPSAANNSTGFRCVRRL
jgi:formylglycine-generating enzyme